MRFRLIVSTACLCLLAGCQTYQPADPDLKSFIAEWRQRQDKIPSINPGGQSQRITVSDGITIKEAVRIGLIYNPDLRIARAAALEPLAAAGYAGLWDDPELETEFARILKNVDNRWISAASLSITIPLSARLEAEKDLAWSQYSESVKSVIAAENEFINQLDTKWNEYSTAAEKIDLTENYLERLSRLCSILSKLADAGEIMPTEYRVIEIARAQRTNELMNLKAQKSLIRSEIIAMIGLVPDCPAVFVADPQSDFEAFPDEDYETMILDRNLSLRLSKAALDSAEKRYALEIEKQHPDLTLGLGWAREEGSNRITASPALPLPVVNANKANISAAKAARDAAVERLKTDYEKLIGRYSTLLNSYRTSQASLRDVRAGISPLIESQLNQIEKLIDIGEIDILILKEALDASYENQISCVEAAMNIRRLAAELDSIINPQFVTKDFDRSLNNE